MIELEIKWKKRMREWMKIAIKDDWMKVGIKGFMKDEWKE